MPVASSTSTSSAGLRENVNNVSALTRTAECSEWLSRIALASLAKAVLARMPPSTLDRSASRSLARMLSGMTGDQVGPCARSLAARSPRNRARDGRGSSSSTTHIVIRIGQHRLVGAATTSPVACRILRRRRVVNQPVPECGQETSQIRIGRNRYARPSGTMVSKLRHTRPTPLPADAAPFARVVCAEEAARARDGQGILAGQSLEVQVTKFAALEDRIPSRFRVRGAVFGGSRGKDFQCLFKVPWREGAL